MSHVGRRVEGDIHPGLGGTVIAEHPSAGRWPRADPTFDVLWDDGSYSRSVARAILEGSWRFRSEPRVSEAECRNLVFDYQVARARELERLHVGRRPAHAPSGEPRLPLPAAMDMETLVHAHPLQPATPTAKVAKDAAKALLRDRFPQTSFGVHCERRILSVAWMDGPLAGGVWKALSELVDHRCVTSVRVTRGLSEELVQAAADYCLWRVCHDDEERGRMGLRVNAQAYLDGSLDLVRTDGGPASGLSFQSLIRCVLERWDDGAQRFRNTRRTQGLLAEMAALFPDDEVAGRHFRMFRSSVSASAQQGREAISNLAATRTMRVRP